MEKLLFNEEQRFWQWWLWLIMIVALLATIIPTAYSVQQEWVQGLPFKEQPASVTETVIVGLISVVVMLGIFSLLFTFRLKTKITNEGILLQFPPLYRKWRHITPDAIDRYEIRKYRAKWEYGGHGPRRRRNAGNAFTVSGNIGLQLILKDGKKILIGTQRKLAIESAMKKMMQAQTF